MTKQDGKWYEQKKVKAELLKKPARFLIAKLGDAEYDAETQGKKSRWYSSQVTAAIQFRLTWWLVAVGVLSFLAATASAVAAIVTACRAGC